MTVLEKIESRIVKAESKLSSFSEFPPEKIEEYIELLNKAQKIKIVRALSCSAPLSMNPQKIKNHLTMVKSYINVLGISDEDLATFASSFSIERVDSYSVAFSCWISSKFSVDAAKN